MAEITNNPLIDKKPVWTNRVIIEMPQGGVERYYFWILNFMKGTKPFGLKYNVEKLQDVFTMTETSAYFGATEQKKALQQDRANQYLKTISEMLKGLFQIVRELRIIDERLDYYDMSQKGDESAEIALKGIWIDRVEGGAKNPGSVYGLAATVGFSILPDLFFTIHPKNKNFIDSSINKFDSEKGLKLNRKLKEITKRKLFEYLIWKERTEKEIRDRRNFNLKYLRQHYETIKLHMNWVRPYLKNARKLEMKQRGMEAPELITAFDSTLIEMEILAYNKDYKKYLPCIFVKFKFIAIPQMAYQEEFQRGAIHTGRTEIDFEGYVLTKDQIEEYKKKLEDEDLELLASINEAIEALGEQLKKYLIEAGEKFGMKKEEEDKRSLLAKWLFPKKKKKEKPEIEYTSPFEPIFALFRGFGELFGFLRFSTGEKKYKIEKFAPERDKAKKEAQEGTLLIYDVFKKYHGLYTW